MKNTTVNFFSDFTFYPVLLHHTHISFFGLFWPDGCLQNASKKCKYHIVAWQIVWQKYAQLWILSLKSMRYVTFFRPANPLQTCEESRLDMRRQLREITDFALVNILTFKSLYRTSHILNLLFWRTEEWFGRFPPHRSPRRGNKLSSSAGRQLLRRCRCQSWSAVWTFTWAGQEVRRSVCRMCNIHPKLVQCYI